MFWTLKDQVSASTQNCVYRQSSLTFWLWFFGAGSLNADCLMFRQKVLILVLFQSSVFFGVFFFLKSYMNKVFHRSRDLSVASHTKTFPHFRIEYGSIIVIELSRTVTFLKVLVRRFRREISSSRLSSFQICLKIRWCGSTKWDFPRISLCCWSKWSPF